MLNILNTSFELGLLYAPVVLGVFITFRVLNFPDLTVDGSFVTGAAITAVAVKNGIPGEIALILSLLAGIACGSLTAFLHTRFGIGKILSGILSVSMLYSINLHLMQGPNISLLNKKETIQLFTAPMNHIDVILFLFLIVIFLKVVLDWFFQTEFGLLLRATGDNESIAKSFSINVNLTKFVGISLSNGLIGFAGGLISQFQGFSDISMGTGTVVLVLAALMLGETMIFNNRISIMTTVVIIGSILYQLIVNTALSFGLAGTDIKFITASIVIVSLIIGGKNKNFLTNEKKLFND